MGWCWSAGWFNNFCSGWFRGWCVGCVGCGGFGFGLGFRQFVFLQQLERGDVGPFAVGFFCRLLFILRAAARFAVLGQGDVAGESAEGGGQGGRFGGDELFPVRFVDQELQAFRGAADFARDVVVADFVNLFFRVFGISCGHESLPHVKGQQRHTKQKQSRSWRADGGEFAGRGHRHIVKALFLFPPHQIQVRNDGGVDLRRQVREYVDFCLAVFRGLVEYDRNSSHAEGIGLVVDADLLFINLTARGFAHMPTLAD